MGTARMLALRLSLLIDRHRLAELVLKGVDPVLIGRVIGQEFRAATRSRRFRSVAGHHRHAAIASPK